MDRIDGDAVSANLLGECMYRDRRGSPYKPRQKIHSQSGSSHRKRPRPRRKPPTPPDPTPTPPHPGNSRTQCNTEQPQRQLLSALLCCCCFFAPRGPVGSAAGEPPAESPAGAWCPYTPDTRAPASITTTTGLVMVGVRVGGYRIYRITCRASISSPNYSVLRPPNRAP
jgi:hypothetical protein